MRKEEYWDTLTIMHDQVPHYSLGKNNIFLVKQEMCYVEAVKVNLPARLGDNTPESKVLYTSVVPSIRILE